jgi:tetratricopeptide (TPR) repeat protein
MEKKIYLKQEKLKVGFGSTAKATAFENYYQVVEVDDNQVEIQMLDFNNRPFGKPSLMPKENLKDYIFCPDFFKSKDNSSQELNVEKHVQSGDKHFQRREYLNAESEYQQALSLDGNHLKANLGIGKTFLARGKKGEARDLFSKLLAMPSLFDAKNKQFLNDVGAELCKQGMFEEAVSYYLKALSVNPNDEVLHYQLGRAYFEQGNRENALRQLESALKLKRDYKEAVDFLSKIQVQP